MSDLKHGVSISTARGQYFDSKGSIFRKSASELQCLQMIMQWERSLKCIIQVNPTHRDSSYLHSQTSKTVAARILSLIKLRESLQASLDELIKIYPKCVLSFNSA